MIYIYILFRLVSHFHLPGDSEKLLRFSFLDFIQVASNIKVLFFLKYSFTSISTKPHSNVQELRKGQIPQGPKDQQGISETLSDEDKILG